MSESVKVLNTKAVPNNIKSRGNTSIFLSILNAVFIFYSSLTKLNKNLPTYEIQFGIVEAFECAGKTVTTLGVTFPVTFAEVPVIVLTIASGSSYSDYGALTAFVDYDTRSTTGFKIRVANHNSSGLSPAINWMAIGKKLS